MRRIAVDDAEEPSAALVSGGDVGHAEAGDDPEDDDGERGANAFWRDSEADVLLRGADAQDAGCDYGESHAAIEDKIDAIAGDARQGLKDEVKDGAACGRAQDGGVQEAVEGKKQTARGAMRSC